MIIRQEDMSYVTAKKIISQVRHPKGWVTVEFEDGDEDMPIQLVLLHLPIWEIYKKLNYPVYKRHILHGPEGFSKESFTGMLTYIYQEICIHASQEILDEFVWALWECINNIDDFGTIELAEHHCSLSLIDMIEIITDPALKDVIHPDLDPKYGTDVIERKMSDARDKLCKILGTRGALKNEALLPYQQANLLNANQIPQVMIAFGPRTEPNDIVIPRPVYGSALSGMKDILDLSIEQQGSRKSAIMNHEAIRQSQYWGRKDQLVTCDIAKVYDHDCGSRYTVNFDITMSNYKNFIGKFIVEADRSLVLLTIGNIKQYIDKTVHMRSVTCCRHTDGVCSVCAGLVVKNLAPGLNVGIIAASTLVSQVSQMILSTKHLIKTNSQIYQLPAGAFDLLERKEDGIHLFDKIRKQPKAKPDSEWYVGLYFSDLQGSISDLLQIQDDMSVPEERFSNISGILIRQMDGVMKQIDLMVDGQCPFLTIQFLMYMKERYKDLIVDEDILWIPMMGMPRLPIFRTAIVNDSMFGYVKSVIKFLETNGLNKHKTCTGALTAFSEIVWSKVQKINILHLEVILRAHMITDSLNWDIPVVDNPDKVRFANTKDIIINRTYSSFNAFQGHRKAFASPSTFVIPRSRGIFDDCFDLSKVYDHRKHPTGI